MVKCFLFAARFARQTLTRFRQGYAWADRTQIVCLRDPAGLRRQNSPSLRDNIIFRPERHAKLSPGQRLFRLSCKRRWIVQAKNLYCLRMSAVKINIFNRKNRYKLRMSSNGYNFFGDDPYFFLVFALSRFRDKRSFGSGLFVTC